MANKISRKEQLEANRAVLSACRKAMIWGCSWLVLGAILGLVFKQISFFISCVLIGFVGVIAWPSIVYGAVMLSLEKKNK